LSQRLANYIQAHTLYSHVRPFGSGLLIASYDKTGPRLYMIEPSGVCYGYFGCALGKARQAAKTELEKLNLKEMTCREVVNHAARMYIMVIYTRFTILISMF
jgi:20S proteasome subunit alpha 7